MKTTTVRLEDHWADMVEAVARRDDSRPSDVLRDAVRRHMVALAADDPALAELLDRALRAALAESEARILKQFAAPDAPARGH